MKDNRGMSFVFVSLLMFVILTLLTTLMTMGLNDTRMSKVINEKSKAYYIAEAGIYFGGTVVLEAVNASNEPSAAVTVNNPFTEYKKTHKFDLNITKEGSSYRVQSTGTYNGQVQRVEALISISGGNINYSQMKKIS